MTSAIQFLVIGLLSGVAAGFFGIGGGVLVVPLLIYWSHFNQHRATGTSLAVLLPPIGIAAVLEYWRNGNVDMRAAIYIAAGMLVGAGLGAYGANKIAGPYLRLAFGIFIVLLGGYLCFGAARRLGWIA